MFLGDAGDRQGSVENLQHAVQLSPDRPRYRAWLAFALARTGQWDRAQEELRDSRRLQREDPNFGAPTEAWLHGLEGVARAAEAGAEASPDGPSAHAFDRALLAYLRDDFERSAELHAEALGCMDSEARLELARSYRYLWAAFAAARAEEGLAVSNAPTAPVDSGRFASLALDWLEADLAAREQDVASLRPSVPLAEHRHALLRSRLIERDLLVLRFPPVEAIWTARSQAHFQRVRATLKRWLEQNE